HRAAALPGGLDRDALSAILARGGTREQLIAVLDQAATTVDPTRRNELLNLTLTRWAQQEPVAAIEYIDANVERLGLDLTRSFSFGGVASQGDVRELLAVADTVRPALATVVRRAALQRLARDDPRAAAAYLENIDFPNANERLSLAS